LKEDLWVERVEEGGRREEMSEWPANTGMGETEYRDAGKD
jgi:hypothetical protein